MSKLPDIITGAAVVTLGIMPLLVLDRVLAVPSGTETAGPYDGFCQTLPNPFWGLGGQNTIACFERDNNQRLVLKCIGDEQVAALYRAERCSK